MKVILDESTGDWRESDKHLFVLLSEDKFFQDAVYEARKKIGVQRDKFYKNFVNTKIYNIAQEYADIIVNTYDLHIFWRIPIAFFIATGRVRSPGEGIYISVLSIPHNPIRNEFVRPSSFQLTVVEKMGFDNLIKYLNKNRKKVKEHLNKLARKRNEIKNLQMRLDIKRLHTEGKTINQILDHLIDKYPDLDPDKEKLRNWINRNEHYLMGYKIT